MAGDVILSVEDLEVSLATASGPLKAVRNTSFELRRGQSLGLVGESGSGKSMTALALMRLLPRIARMSARKLEFDGRDLTGIDDKAFFNTIAGQRMAMIFQEPMTSLNPVYNIGRQITEASVRAGLLDGRKARERAVELLDRVGIPEPREQMDRYPHQLSGGQRQRVMIAMALMTDPQLIVADEPTTALDVTIQAQIMDLLGGLQREFGMAMILITHDLAVVSETVNDVAVMYGGEIVEQGPCADLLSRPMHPYTRALIASAPQMQGEPLRLGAIPGVVPTLLGDLDHCVFASRCPHVRSICRSEVPPKRHPSPDRLYKCVMEGGEIGQLAPARPLEPLPEPEVDEEAVLSARDIVRVFRRKKGLFGPETEIRAVDGVSLKVQRGETFALVGESGSGKTTLSKILLGLDQPTSGEVCLDGVPIDQVPRLERAKRMQPVFQDPYSSLNPRQTVRQIIELPLLVHGHSDARQRLRTIEETMDLVGLPRRVIHNYPNQMSGGQRQRIAIARALVTRPAILICDEPTSALDVSVQAQILNLMVDLQQELQLTYVMITHDLGVVHQIATRLAVMHRGRIVETGRAREVLSAPNEDYTRLLLSSVPHFETAPHSQDAMAQ